ncbi:AMP-binding protein [Kribbella sp. NBC_01505]|uniref:AMP-binding protein n=1 Tax=Kribbella sp. NBC_01505 TaxID=2903580 RepID=UPI00386412B8
MPSTPCFLLHVQLQTHLTRVTMTGMSLPSYASGISDVPLLGETIGANLRRTIAQYGDREALVEVQTGRRWTYAELGAEVDRVAKGLLARGIAKGDRVGIWAPNCAEWTITQYATATMGAILVNINPAYRTHELSYALNQSGVRLLISATEFKTSNYRAMVEEVRPNCAALEETVYIGTGDWDSLRDAADRITDEELQQRIDELSFDDPINIQYTSGTTGFPKGATLSHHNILNNGFFVTETIAFTAEDRLCIPVPFYHWKGSRRNLSVRGVTSRHSLLGLQVAGGLHPYPTSFYTGAR